METETIACAVLIAAEVTEHYGNDAIGTRMGSLSGTSSFYLVAVNATLEKSSFKTSSEVAAHAYGAAETLRVRCENETNEIPTQSSHACFRRNWKEFFLQMLHLCFTNSLFNTPISYLQPEYQESQTLRGNAVGPQLNEVKIGIC